MAQVRYEFPIEKVPAMDSAAMPQPTHRASPSMQMSALPQLPVPYLSLRLCPSPQCVQSGRGPQSLPALVRKPRPSEGAGSAPPLPTPQSGSGALQNHRAEPHLPPAPAVVPGPRPLRSRLKAPHWHTPPGAGDGHSRRHGLFATCAWNSSMPTPNLPKEFPPAARDMEKALFRDGKIW